MKIDLSKVDRVIVLNQDNEVTEDFAIHSVELVSGQLTGRILKLKKTTY
jgi:hypothetical protein